MKLFKRNKTAVNPNLPPEVQAYSQAEHRERMGMAWLVGVVSLIVTVLVLAGLYFGGRWVYRKIAGTDSPTTSEVADRQAEDKKAADQKEANKKQDEQAKDTPAAVPTPSEPTPSAASQPAAQSSDLPRTGPDLDL